MICTLKSTILGTPNLGRLFWDTFLGQGKIFQI